MRDVHFQKPVSVHTYVSHFCYPLSNMDSVHACVSRACCSCFPAWILCLDMCLMPAVDSSSMVSVGAYHTYALALALARAVWDLTKQHVP